MCISIIGLVVTMYITALISGEQNTAHVVRTKGQYSTVYDLVEALKIHFNAASHRCIHAGIVFQSPLLACQINVYYSNFFCYILVFADKYNNSQGITLIAFFKRWIRYGGIEHS
jgi:hypothetical protein